MRARAVAVLTAALLVVGSTAGVAGAQEQVLRDPAGDMWAMGYAGNSTAAPQMRTGDVRRAAFRHRRSDVMVRQRFVDLRRVGRYTQHAVRLQTGSNLFREAVVVAGPGSWGGTVEVFNRRGRVECDARHRIDYRRETVLIRVPRSCLGEPARVRASADSTWAQSRRDEFLVDNPHHTRASVNRRTWTRWLRVG
jgi:hypothetical protein